MARDPLKYPHLRMVIQNIDECIIIHNVLGKQNGVILSSSSGANFRSTLGGGGHKYFVQMCSTKKQAITLLQSPAFRIVGSEQ